MQPIDTVFLVLFAILTLRCFLKGFTGEFISLASLVFGVMAALFFFRPGAAFIRTKAFSGVQFLPEILAFIALFGIVFIAGKFLGRLVKDIVNGLHLEGIDRFLGLLLGMMEGAALVSVLLVALWAQPLFDPGPLLSRSIAARLLLPLTGLVRESFFSGL